MNALITTPGFYPDITPEQYFAEPCPAPALTNSGIGTLLRYCPAKFAHQHPAIGQPAEERKDTAATYMGSLVHRLALDKGADYAISPHAEYRTDEAKGWKKAQIEAGLIPVKAQAFEEAQAMACIIRERIVEACEGRAYETELVIAWKRRGRWCRAMLDVWCEPLLRARDVKTIVSADDISLDRAFSSGGYGRQDAWYFDGIDRLTGRTGRVDFGFLFVEKEAPFLPRNARVTEGMRTGSMLDCDRAFETFDTCMTNGEWPGYSDHAAQPTSWQAREWADAELEAA